MPNHPEKMMELAEKLAQAADGEEVMSILDEMGYELSPTGEVADEPLTMDMKEEVTEEKMADGEEGAEMMEEVMEKMPMPMPTPEEGPRLNIVAARFRAADNALKKGKKSNERR